MGYRIRYTWNIDWVPNNTSGMSTLSRYNKPTVGGTQNNSSPVAVGGSTTFTITPGNTVSGALSSADITTLANGAAADVNAQANTFLAQMQAWATPVNNGVW